MHILLPNKYNILARGVIGEVRCGFFKIYAPTPYSVISLLHTLAPAPIKIGLGAVRCGAVWCSSYGFNF
jgi:hypothetical protein